MSHQKKTVTPKSFAYRRMKAIFVEFFNTSIPLSAVVQNLFSLDIKKFFAQKRLSEAHFQMLIFFKRKPIIFCLQIW